MHRYLYLSFLFLDVALAQTGVFSVRKDTTLANQYLTRAEKLSQTAEGDSVNFYLEKALTIRRRVFGENHLEMGRAYFKTGKYGFAGDLDKKLEYVYKALAILLPRLGENHTEVGACYGRAGSLQNAKGNFDTAIELLLKALAIRLKQLGKAHPDVGHTYNELGQLTRARKIIRTPVKTLPLPERFFGKFLAKTTSSWRGAMLISPWSMERMNSTTKPWNMPLRLWTYLNDYLATMQLGLTTATSAIIIWVKGITIRPLLISKTPSIYFVVWDRKKPWLLPAVTKFWEISILAATKLKKLWVSIKNRLSRSFQVLPIATFM